MGITRLYTGPDGQTHIEELDLLPSGAHPAHGDEGRGVSERGARPF